MAFDGTLVGRSGVVGKVPESGPIPESGPPQSVPHYRPGRETTHGDQPRESIVSIEQPVTGDSV